MAQTAGAQKTSACSSSCLCYAWNRLGLIFSVRAKLVAPVVWGTVLLSILYFWAMAMIVVPLIRYTAPVIGVGFLLVRVMLFYLFRKGTTFERTNKSGTRDHAVPHI